jgi:hypothetical protein
MQMKMRMRMKIMRSMSLNHILSRSSH